MVTIKADSADYGINFPSAINELTSDILNKITDGINIPKNYVIVALAFKTRVFDLVVSMNSKTQQNFAVTPILAKTDDDSLKYLNANVGNKLIISRSALERGVHINLPIAITSNNVSLYLDTFKDLATAIVRKTNAIADKEIILLEFKVIPVTDITASMKIDRNVEDIFIVED